MQCDNPALPSDLKVREVFIDGEDISAFCPSFTIYQDVFLAGWTCELLIHDMNNIIMNQKIKPGSEIKLKIETKVDSELDAKKEFKFQVSHISNKQFQNWKETTYTIHGIDKNLFKNLGKRVSKLYKEKKPEKIVDDIISEYIGGNLAEKDSTDYPITIIIPNIAPFSACSLVARSAAKGDVADFLLFQKDDNQYVFKSLEEMYKGRESGITFKMLPTGIRDEKGNLEEDYCVRFQNYHFVDHTNGLLAANSGQAANKLVEFDFIQKKWTETDYRYSDEISQDKEKKQWTDDLENPDANIIFKPKHPGLHESATILDFTQKWQSSRRSNLLKLEQDKLIIQVPGGVKGWEFLGKTCKVDLPSQQDKEKEELDKQFKGKYFIAAIAHIVSNNAYFVNYELIKKRTEVKL